MVKKYKDKNGIHLVVSYILQMKIDRCFVSHSFLPGRIEIRGILGKDGNSKVSVNKRRKRIIRFISKYTMPAIKIKFFATGCVDGGSEEVGRQWWSLRSSSIEISGVGGGSIPLEIMMKIPAEYLPEIFNPAAEKKLIIDTETISINEIEAAWKRDDLPGKRLVIVP